MLYFWKLGPAVPAADDPDAWDQNALWVRARQRGLSGVPRTPKDNAFYQAFHEEKHRRLVAARTEWAHTVSWPRVIWACLRNVLSGVPFPCDAAHEAAERDAKVGHTVWCTVHENMRIHEEGR